jgi:hypothetical protein
VIASTRVKGCRVPSLAGAPGSLADTGGSFGRGSAGYRVIRYRRSFLFWVQLCREVIGSDVAIKGYSCRDVQD